MKANRVLNRKKENENKRKEDATEAISIMTNKSVQINFDYSKLQDINEEEKQQSQEGCCEKAACKSRRRRKAEFYSA